ncbi:acyl carrier protein [Pseudomonas sp. BIGb0427]|uniref:acyl carrier protein n=1 Tax=unclassified Pseudomonas TaxID=196821 RepID=UPI00089063E7|nr:MULTISPECIES: acyl carrier protein [unclassified Pseudomonas]NLU60514.1 acyl carrier protein [Pseudomonas sp. BIGb0427]QPG62224.1 acyl carrier protein [Pseudomonas sp. BIGb0427]QVM99029.1 acyl carrier protein [Pseudomonas sp. SORT22]UVM64563.1 acyl carrier protein [Pseudomonas sp. B21-009]SDQ66232.1 Acyl carrier protein [Pseudomonas sp. UC 17F4]
MSQQQIAQWLREHLASLLKLDLAQVDSALAFDEYGVASRDAVGMIGELGEWLERELDPALVYDYPSIDELSNHLSTFTRAEP